MSALFADIAALLRRVVFISETTTGNIVPTEHHEDFAAGGSK